MKLELKRDSWNNLFQVIREQNPAIMPKGNFWASVQSLEEQLKDKSDFFYNVTNSKQLSIEQKLTIEIGDQFDFEGFSYEEVEGVYPFLDESLSEVQL